MEAGISFLERVLGLKRPFSILWDPRPLRWPSVTPAQIGKAKAWTDAHVVEWDTHVQGHALLLTNPVVRSIATLLTKLFAPPQPLAVVEDEAGALDFARTCCVRPRSWVKDSYEDAADAGGSSWTSVIATRLGLA